jgi:hypothetical protein
MKVGTTHLFSYLWAHIAFVDVFVTLLSLFTKTCGEKNQQSSKESRLLSARLQYRHFSDPDKIGSL